MNTAWTNRCLIKEMLRKELLESSLSGFKLQDSRVRKKILESSLSFFKL